MSEPRLPPAQLRRKALTLMRQCFLPLLVAAVLLSLPGLGADLIRLHGENAAERVEQAVFAEFEAANPRPEDPAELEQWESDKIVYAYFSSADINGKLAERLWSLLASGAELLGMLLGGVLLAGVYAGLLSRLRGSCEPLRPFCCLRRWKTALWLRLRVMAFIFGWLLLAILPAAFLPGGPGALLLLPVALWAELHYSLVLPCMADDPADRLNTTQYLDLGAAHIRFFTVGGLLRVLWPLMLLFLAEAALTLAAAWLPALTLPGMLFALAADVFTMMLGCACIACIHAEVALHQPAPAE